ncbi:MAG: TonB-dependent receptor [Vicinamibacterales bacterium]
MNLQIIIRRAAVTLAPALFAFIAVLPAAAQDATQLTVTVSDTSGARITDVAVVLSRAAQEKAVTTGTEGTAVVPGLAIGTWTVDVSHDGFLPVRRQVVIQTAPVNLNVTLELSGLRQSVLVEASRPEDALQLDAPAAGGTRLDIPVRELPASLTVITQALLQERGINNAMDATELAPGVTTFVDSGSIPGINARGFSSTSGAVTVTRDGIRQNTVPQSGRPLDTFMLERVEVLKGPASLLSGEGAIGASINYVTKEPRRNLEIDTLASLGSFDKYRAGLGLSVPFTSKLAGRVDYSKADGGGYVDRTGDGMQSALGALRFTPTASTMFGGSVVWTHDDIRSYYGTPIIDGAIDPRTRFLNYNMRDNHNVATNNFYKFDADFMFGGWTLHEGVSAATQYVEWRNFESTQFVPATRQVQVGSYFLAKRDDLLWGHQLDARRAFALGRRSITFVGGYQYQNNDMDRYTGGTIPNQNRLVDPYDPAPIYDPGFPFVFDRTVKVFTHTLFGEAQVALHDKFKVVSGLRWERFEVERNQVSTGFAEHKYYPTTGRLGAVYLPTPLTSLYVSYSRAVEPQTPLVSISGANMAAFTLMPSRQIEVGTKATVIGGRADLTAAFFQINKKDIPTSTIVDGVRIQQQIGEQQARGLELSFSARPWAGMQLMSDVTFLNDEYVEFNENLGTGVIARAGNDVPHFPATVWNLTPMQRIGPVTASVTIRHVGERFRDNANTLTLQPYTTTTLALSSPVTNGLRVTLTVRNLTDELYIPRSNSDVSGRVAAPRNFEIQFTRVFNPR